MKFFAFYLPQFHAIPENDEWWGKGFSEWNNVKKATPQYKGHVQPIHPLNDNYYNLLDKKTVEWQTELLKQYHVSGMIYYHYYFNGKLLLEKPAENLLQWKDINQPFFFCWANHTWVSSWDGSDKVLMEQTYGEKKDWQDHFDYLLPFFKDPRYEKKDNCPLFMIFVPDFTERIEMYRFFDEKCKQNGFSGIHIIDVINDKEVLDELRKTNPLEHYSIHLLNMKKAIDLFISRKQAFNEKINKIPKIGSFILKRRGIFLSDNVVSGNKIFDWKCSKLVKSRDIIHSLVFHWDNTPRYGKAGTVITPVDKKRFLKYMNLIKDEEYCFIFAWNEWSEGSILEPTKEEGYKYLEWIQKWKEQYDI